MILLKGHDTVPSRERLYMAYNLNHFRLNAGTVGKNQLKVRDIPESSTWSLLEKLEHGIHVYLNMFCYQMS